MDYFRMTFNALSLIYIDNRVKDGYLYTFMENKKRIN